MEDIIFKIIIAPVLLVEAAFALFIIGIFLYAFYAILLMVLINPIYWLFTRKNLKAYEEFRDMPSEFDFM
jgi:hypothetical protein